MGLFDKKPSFPGKQVDVNAFVQGLLNPEWTKQALPMEGRAGLLPFRDSLPGSVMNKRELALPGLLAGMVNAVTSPGRAYSGSDPGFNPEEEAANLAGNIMLGGVGATAVNPAPSGALGMFIGRKAKTWNAKAAKQAEEMLANGVDPREVWKQTGTMRGVDNALRQEIPDNSSQLRMMPRAKQMLESRPLDSFISHPELFDSYPYLTKANVRLNSGNSSKGAYLPESNTIELTGLSETAPYSMAGEVKSTAMHELQHAIQQREGWAKGGSPASMRQEVGVNPNDAYKRLAGEAEARLTQARMNMTMPERLQSYPYDMLDVPQEQLIVRGLLGEDTGPAMQTVYHGSPHKFDKFDMSKIGTGEGAQAYGHGLYMAESPDVARQYQKNLSGYAEVNGVKLKGGIADQNASPERLAEILLAPVQNSDDFARAYEIAKTWRGGAAAKVIDDWKNNGSLQFGDQGAFYKVDIPDEAIPRMLDWDKPLSEQAEALEAMKRAGYAPSPEITAGDFVRSKNSEGFGAYLSDDLAKQGIPGIRYLDGSSRTAGQGTSNYVLFDDQLPRILEVNGQPTGLLSYADEAAKKTKKK